MLAAVWLMTIYACPAISVLFRQTEYFPLDGCPSSVMESTTAGGPKGAEPDRGGRSGNRLFYANGKMRFDFYSIKK